MLRAVALAVLVGGGPALAASDRLHFDIEHPFSRADARARTQLLFDYWSRAYGVVATWTGDTAQITGRVMGVEINAVLVVGDDHIGGDGDDPGPILRSLARSYITRKLKKYMHPQYLEP